MKKHFFLALFFFLTSNLIFSQNLNLPDGSSGEMMLTNDEKILFSDLKSDDEKYYFFNLNSRKEDFIYKQSVKSIDISQVINKKVKAVKENFEQEKLTNIQQKPDKIYSNVNLTLNNQLPFNVKKVEIFNSNQNIVYHLQDGTTKNASFSDISQIKLKKGSHVWSGLAGGFVGSIIGKLISSSEEKPWWYGAGPVILIGTGVGGIIGALIPRYEPIDLKKGKLEVSLNSIKYSF